ncbi:MAG: DUF2309 domain-containing protein, partial [Alphaproteobacteria bacterium]|nr:DUF2309 domain-containing protein [Alphaproteobacteria bacterium]
GAPGAAAETAPLPAFADCVSRARGRDWAGLIRERIAAALADHFDEGQALWRDPALGDGLYTAWLAVARVDRTLDLAGLPGFAKALAGLPACPEAVLCASVDRLGLPGEALADYFHRLLMSLPGWAGYARYREWQAGLAGGTDRTLTELLAILAATEAAVFEIAGADVTAARLWAEARDGFAQPVAPGPELRLDAVLQRAYEAGWQRSFREGFKHAPGKAVAPAGRPRVQAAFCIDVRSEVFRRAFEAAGPDVETLGFAGFFGLAIDYVPLGAEEGGARCPVLLSPAVTIRERIKGTDARAEAAHLARQGARAGADRAWKNFKLAAVSSFAFVEVMGLAYVNRLVRDGFGGGKRACGHARHALGPDPAPGTHGGRPTGLDLPARIDAAEAMLRGMSLTSGFARLMLLVGHGSSSTNNPHASGLDCGACGGHDGSVNARLAAMLLNDGEVRAGLAGRGIVLRHDCHAIGALHDTTTDEVHFYDLDTLPPTHAEDLAWLRAALSRAGAIARAERAGRLKLSPDAPVDDGIRARARDWAQVRPEWGLAGCAAFIAAPRARTRGRDLGGRAFLHSYDWRADAGFRTLELILTAPMVVASWISLQYYGSVVDNRAFGSGNKVLHNVVGTMGVLEGAGGDLRPGLPLQSLHDGERFVHEPLRLTVLVEAPREAIGSIIGRHPTVRDLLDNGWLHLMVLDEDGVPAFRYAGGLDWTALEPGRA